MIVNALVRLRPGAAALGVDLLGRACSGLRCRSGGAVADSVFAPDDLAVPPPPTGR